MDWTWKVFKRGDGSADFIPAEAQTQFEVIAHSLPLRDAMALCDEINAAIACPTPATGA